MSQKKCHSCGGKRLKDEALAVTVGGMNIHGLTALSVHDCIRFFTEVKLSNLEKQIAGQIFERNYLEAILPRPRSALTT